jgi:hypothetical protein
MGRKEGQKVEGRRSRDGGVCRRGASRCARGGPAPREAKGGKGNAEDCTANYAKDANPLGVGLVVRCELFADTKACCRNQTGAHGVIPKTAVQPRIHTDGHGYQEFAENHRFTRKVNGNSGRKTDTGRSE